MTDLKGQKEGRKRKDRVERKEVGRKTAKDVEIVAKKITGESRHQEEGTKEGETDERRRGGLRRKRGYIATCVNTYQLISPEFLSSLKHSPKVDCGRQKTNKAVRNCEKGPELKHMTSETVVTAERGRWIQCRRTYLDPSVIAGHGGVKFTNCVNCFVVKSITMDHIL